MLIKEEALDLLLEIKENNYADPNVRQFVGDILDLIHWQSTMMHFSIINGIFLRLFRFLCSSYEDWSGHILDTVDSFEQPPSDKNTLTDVSSVLIDSN